MEHIYSIPYHDFTRLQKYSCALKKAQKYQGPVAKFKKTDRKRVEAAIGRQVILKQKSPR